jgi:hypothetical protein
MRREMERGRKRGREGRRDGGRKEGRKGREGKGKEGRKGRKELRHLGLQHPILILTSIYPQNFWFLHLSNIKKNKSSTYGGVYFI